MGIRKRNKKRTWEEARIAGSNYARTLLNESDRGATLLLAEKLNEALGSLHKSVIGSHLATGSGAMVKKLFGYSAPLSNFSSRIDLAAAYGLITADQLHDLHCIRELRNEAAHGTEHFSFDDQEIRLAILSLKSLPENRTTLQYRSPSKKRLFECAEALDAVLCQSSFEFAIRNLKGRHYEPPGPKA
jgi:DNA-binding MltR family transcriptional regulator